MADELPSVEVSHLASSSSFYSAILQPLGLTYMHADGRSPAVVSFGANGKAALQLRQSPGPRLSSVLVGAPSMSALARFHDCGIRANPPMLLQGRVGGLRQNGGGVVRATVVDLDGNMIEAVYPDPRPQLRGETDCGPSRSSATAPPPDARPVADVRPRELPPQPSGSTSSSAGVKASALVGALLGVAAGAALTYGLVSRDRDHRPASADSHGAHQQDDGPGCRRIPLSYPRRQGIFSALDRRGRIPPRSLPWTTPHSGDGQSVARRRFVDDDYDARRHRSSRVASSVRSHSEAPSQRAPTQQAPSQQPPSRLASSNRAPLSAASLGDRRSHGRPPWQHGDRPRAVGEAEPSTFVSAHSRRSSTPQQPRSENGLPFRAGSVSAVQGAAATGCLVVRSSRAQSCVSARHIPLPASQAPSCVSARQVPLPASQALSYLSARHMPLPASGVGSSHANWDDDLDSLGPSDSISCVGSGSRRRRDN